ncbi:MAG: phosphomannomutase/phosphoglucomutase [Selenomonadaceae bacterium]|nr:phosphomannomutase/phosphoglucomutase [Selenomonadaceae bacterium]
MLDDKQIMKLQNGSDVRGIAVDGVEGESVNLTTEAVNRIASGFVEFLAQKLKRPKNTLKIAIGHDSRISAPQIKEAACKALIHNGVKVIDCGLASTPAMFMSIIFNETKVDGSIMLTASHLPFNRNGMKFFTKNGGLEHDDIHAVLTNATKVEEVDANIDNIQKFDLISLYSNHLCNKIRQKLNVGDKPLAGMHIVVDAGNGGGGFFASKVLEPLGADISGSQFLEPDGMFPNHIPNPEDKKAMAAIKKAVLDNKADLGLIFDTDVDRMSAVLSDGEEVNRNALIAMMAAILAPDYPSSTIVTDSVTSDELSKFLERDLRLHHLRYMRGYKNVINKCIELNLAGITSPLAIETSGHGALSENYYLDDGAYLAVKLLIAAAKARQSGKNLASLIEKLEYPAEAVEYRLKIVGVENFKAYGSKVLETFQSRAIDKGIGIAEPSFEGVRLIFKGDGADGWALLRMSLHDPNMPLNIESKTSGGCKHIYQIVKELINGFDALVVPE